MTREQLIAFLRACVATLALGLLIWFLRHLGVTIPVPHVVPTMLQICSIVQEHHR